MGRSSMQNVVRPIPKQWLLVPVGVAVVTTAEAQDGPESPSPVRMNPESMAGLGLTPIPNGGFTDILVEGEHAIVATQRSE